MKRIGFIGSVIYAYKDVVKPTTRYDKFRALAEGMQSIIYIPVNDIKKPKILERNRHLEIAVPCSVYGLSRLLPQISFQKNRFMYLLVMFVQYFSYMLRVVSRMKKDNIDLYVIIHLWASIPAILSPLLNMTNRPHGIIRLGPYALKWYYEINILLYWIVVCLFKIALNLNSFVILSLDQEHRFYLFKVLKINKTKIFNFKHSIVNDNVFHELDKRTCLRQLGFNEDDINVVMVSRIESPEYIEARSFDKNPFLALDTFHLLAKMCPRVHLHVIGAGNGAAAFKDKVDNYQLQHRVSLHGWVDNKELPKYYSAADLTFFPHPLIEFHAGTGIFESILCATPVIAFKRYRWVKTEQIGGFLVDKEPKIAAEEIIHRLNRKYLNMKREETKFVPRDFTVNAFKRNLTNVFTVFLWKSQSHVNG